MAKPTKLSQQKIKQSLAKLNGWKRDRNTLTKEFTLASFTGAARFIAKIAPIANRMDHHPDLQLYRYKRVKIKLTTHDAGGITQKDFDLAAKIDTLAPLGIGRA
jgi:4a-hydroxytetrahydrobiopterin dehydratase